MFDPYIYFNHGIITSDFVRNYNYFNQNDSKFINQRSLGISEFNDYIPDFIYQELFYLIPMIQ